MLSEDLEELGGEKEEERDGDEASGLLLAGAILRFLRRGVDWLNGRASEGVQGALLVYLRLVNERRGADDAEDRPQRRLQERELAVELSLSRIGN